VRELKSYGRVTPAEEFDINATVSATVQEVRFDQGESVEVGQLLVKLDARHFELELEQAGAALSEAQARFDEASANHFRIEAIHEKRLVSEQAFKQSEATLAAARAALANAGAAFDIARERLKDTEVISPVSGIVSRRTIEPGQTANPMSSLGVIQLQNRMRVESYVSQKDVNFLRTGMNVKVTSPGTPGQEFTGVIESLAFSAEPRTGNFEVRIVLDETNGLLRDGMSAEVQFNNLAQSDVITLPREALVDRNRRLIVFRVVDDKARAVEPMIGIGNSSAVPLIRGLDPGDEIIISNLRLISDGQKIKRVSG
jgi:membrane fusion protein (multidrug efflux system)